MIEQNTQLAATNEALQQQFVATQRQQIDLKASHDTLQRQLTDLSATINAVHQDQSTAKEQMGRLVQVQRGLVPLGIDPAVTAAMDTIEDWATS